VWNYSWTQDVTVDNFKRLLKTFFGGFQRTSAISALDVLRRYALQIYILLTDLLTSDQELTFASETYVRNFQT